MLILICSPAGTTCVFSRRDVSQRSEQGRILTRCPLNELLPCALGVLEQVLAPGDALARLVWVCGPCASPLDRDIS